MNRNDKNLEMQNYKGDAVSIITNENRSITDTKKIAKH